MKHRRPILAFALLAASLVALPASAETLSDARARTLADVETILGPDGQSAVAPVVEDAKRRISDAMAAVSSKDTPPRNILTFSQKIAMARAMRAGEQPQLALDDSQRAAMNVYVTDLAAAVLPIAREDGSKIEGAITPYRRARIEDLRTHSLAELDRRAAGFGLSSQVDALVSAAGTRDAVGAFVLLVEIDGRSLVNRR